MTCYVPTLLVFLEALHVCVLEILQLKHTNEIYGFEFLLKVTMKISVVWNVTPCCLADVYRLERKKSVSRRQGGKENFRDVIREMGEQMVEEPNRKSLQ